MSRLIVISVILVSWSPNSLEFYQVPVIQAGINAGINPQANFNGAFNQIRQGINPFQAPPQLAIQQQLLANQISGVQNQFVNQVYGMQNQAQHVMQNQFQNIGNFIHNVQDQQLNLIRQMQEIARQRASMMNQNINQAFNHNPNIPIAQQNQFFASHQNANPGFNGQLNLQQIRPQMVPAVVAAKPQQPVTQLLNAQGLQRIPTIETPNLLLMDGFINPFEVLKEKLSILKLNQNPLLTYLTDIIKSSIQTFNAQFNDSYKQYLANLQESIKLAQTTPQNLLQQAQDTVDVSLGNILALFRSNIIETMKRLVKTLKIDVNCLQDPQNALIVLSNSSYLANDQSTKLPNVSGVVPSINSTLLNQISNSLVNTSDSSIATVLKNLKDKSALLLDDGTIFKNYLVRINSSEETITQWDAMVKNKDESGKLNLTSFAKVDPFCSCNDIVACNCCLSLNFNFFNKEVCLEATVPKSGNGTKLSIIVDKNRQGITQTQGLDEKVKFNFEGLASGVLEITRREGSTKTNLEEEFCGAASLDILGLSFRALPLGCYSLTNDTFSFIDDLR